MKIRTLKSDALLLLASAIWGFAFVAQRIGMDYVGPFTFNGVRFALGSLVLLPLILRNGIRKNASRKSTSSAGTKTLIFGSGLLGITLFAAASFQQVGLIYTTAGNAGFITGLYVVIVPILGLFWGQHLNAGTWIGALLAAVGLYFLSVTDELTISFGDFLELIGAFLWALQILIVGWLSNKIDPVKLAFAEFSACSLLILCYRPPYPFYTAVFFPLVWLSPFRWLLSKKPILLMPPYFLVWNRFLPLLVVGLF
jgi:drug/metabolite transporter (DMT)-like permease